MFGLISSQNDTWNWAAFGKHPIGGDFLKSGTVTPLLKSFSIWMEKGFSLIHEEKRKTTFFYWQFFAKGPNSELICGILKSSFDSHGRIFPLLIIGSGKSNNLFKNWHLIPYSCLDTWENLSDLSQKKFKNIKELKNELKNITPPLMDLKQLNHKREKGKNVKIPGDFKYKMNNLEALCRVNNFIIPDKDSRPDEFHIHTSKLFYLLKSRPNNEPSAVFMGGGLNKEKEKNESNT